MSTTLAFQSLYDAIHEWWIITKASDYSQLLTSISIALAFIIVSLLLLSQVETKKPNRNKTPASSTSKNPSE
jgi:hypothetical protein